MNEFLEQFLIEGRELVEQATRDLLELEQRPADKERLDGAFRAFHTLKGAAGIVEFEPMSRALHVVEDALSAVRSGKQAVSPRLISSCLASLDQVIAWMRAIEAGDDLPTGADVQADKIVALFEAAPAQPTAPVEGGVYAHAHDLLESQRLLGAISFETAGGEAMRSAAFKTGANVLDAIGLKAAADRLRGSDPAAVSRELLDVLFTEAKAALTAPVIEGERGEQIRALRVEVSRVDALVKLTGELTTAVNAIGHLADRARAESGELGQSLSDQHAVLQRLTSELQRSVLNVRVLPMSHVLQRFPKLVRDISVELDKAARLIIEGGDTEADKAVVEALFEPLLHVVRNALDHGVESAETRAERSKPAVARIVVRARRDGDAVIVEVEDDGAGIDVARVRALAIERGLAPAEEIEALSDDEAARLIFTPGFSTASTVTAISGRGVGMDVVKTAIARLGGEVELENMPGAGMLVRFRLPFTIMMTRVLVVEAAGQLFGVPFEAVVETVRRERSELTAIGKGQAFVYRDQTAPVIDLAQALSIGSAAEGAALIVITETGERAGFMVDRVDGALDVMLTPLEGLLAGMPGVAGATLMGDGQVLIVINPDQLLDV